MKNKYKLFLFLCASLFIMASCSGSKNIQKKWKAEDAVNKVFSIEFKDKEMIVSNENETEKLAYKQNAVGVSNGIKYYGITVNNQSYSVIFPEKGNEELALLMRISGDDYLDGTLVYAMNTKEQPDYKEYAVKFLNN